MKREKSTEQQLRCPVFFFGAGSSRRALGREKSSGGNVKILLPETEVQGLTGSGEQRKLAAGGACDPNPAAGM